MFGSRFSRILLKACQKAAPNFMCNTILRNELSSKKEYLQGPSEDVVKILNDICLPEIERLENLLNIKLDSWKNLPKVR